MQISSAAAVSFYALIQKRAPTAAQSMAGSAGAAQAQSDAASGSSSGTSSADGSAEQTFLNYMKETPAQRMEDAWLAAHHLTRQELAAMSPDKRQAIEKQMEEDIKNELKKETEDKARGKTDILA